MSKIAVSTYSFSNALYTEKIPTLDDLFRIIKELGIDGVEIVSFNIMDGGSPMGGGDPDKGPEPVLPDGSKGGADVKPNTPPRQLNPAFMKEMRERMDKAARVRPAAIDEIKKLLVKYGLEVCNMPVDFGDIGSSDDERRASDIEMLKMWIDIAAELGCPSIRVNSGEVIKRDDGSIDLSRCIDSYRKLAEYGAGKGVMVTMENHGGATNFPEQCVEIFEGVNHPNFRLIPDIGNFHLGEDMYRGIDMMLGCGQAPCMHVKTYAFGEEYGEGCDSHTDFKRMGEIAKKHGYNGWYSIECNGACGKDFINVIKTKELIGKYFC